MFSTSLLLLLNCFPWSSHVSCSVLMPIWLLPSSLSGLLFVHVFLPLFDAAYAKTSVVLLGLHSLFPQRVVLVFSVESVFI